MRDLADRRLAGPLLLAMLVAGALLGLVWSAWSPPGPQAFVLAPGVLYPFEESESFVAADGRYLVITAAVGLVAAFAAWSRRAGRGSLIVITLAIGGLGGAALTQLIGHLTGGGTFSGRVHTTISRLPLSLHMTGLLFVEPALAVLVYGVLVAFASHDDLGRPDPARDSVRAARGSAASEPASVGAGDSVRPGDHAQDGGGHGDRPGPLQ